MTEKPGDPKDPSRSPEDEELAPGLKSLRNVFGKFAFEKGPAYQDEAKEEEIGAREGLRRSPRRRLRTTKKPSGPEKPPQAFPGP
ncbi:MAG: hypothetical protein AABZ64_15360 [Nitrospinota bacterium]